MAVGGRRRADSRLAAELAAGATVAEAARRAGVGERTAARRADITMQAVDCLVGLLSARSEMARVAAARTILEHAINLRELTSLEARVTRLKAILEGSDDASSVAVEKP